MIRIVTIAITISALGSSALAAPPVCPHICYWRSDIAEWARGAPWIKVLSALDCQRGHDLGCKVFYRPYDIPGHDDGGTGDGTGMAEAVLARLATIPSDKWPEAIGYRNEFGGSDTTTTAQFINYYNRLRAGGYKGWIVFGSYSTGVPESYRWSQSDVRNAVNLADAIETHEYFDLTEAKCHSWLMCRHVRFINENPYLAGKPWFIGEAGSDRISNASCREDPCNRRGWRYVDCGAQKLTASQYINELNIYRNLCANQVVAIFLFQQGDTNWADFDVMGTEVATWMQGTWPAVTTGTIVGNVKNTSGQNLSGVSVSTDTGGYSTTTDAAGNYTIPGVMPGTYSVSASKTGYVTSTQAGKVVSANQTTIVNFTLMPVPPGTLAGTVKSVSGQVLEGATVTIAPGGASAVTNAQGNYTISGLAVGNYTATASKQGYTESVAPVTIQSGLTTTQNFTLHNLGTELLTNGSFTSGCTGWSKSQTPSGAYWGCGNKAYPNPWPGQGGHSWNAFIACGGFFCDTSFTGEQHQDNVVVRAGLSYWASAQVYYEPILHAGDPTDQKERIVLAFNNGVTHSSAWHTHTTPNGWDRITLSGAVPSGATSMTFKVELAHTDGQWSGTGAIDECSFQVPTGTISSAKGYPDGTVIMLRNKTVTASNGSAFWIEEDDRTSGIKVAASNSLTPGTRVSWVSGILTTVNGERVLGQALFAPE